MFKLVEDSNNRKSILANAKLPNHVSKGIRRGAYISGKELVADLKQDMKAGKSGKTYKIYKGVGGKSLKRSRLHKASAAGESPAVITGEFRKSIDFVVRGSKQLEFGSGSGGLATKYAKILELGSSKMAARRPLGRTVSKLQNQVKTNITRELNKQIKAAGFKVTGV